MSVKFSQLQCKEVICVDSGQRLGFVSDVELDVKDARLLSILVPGEGSLFGRGPSLRIPWACIEHIGEDLIIVNIKDPAVRDKGGNGGMRS